MGAPDSHTKRAVVLESMTRRCSALTPGFLADSGALRPCGDVDDDHVIGPAADENIDMDFGEDDFSLPPPVLGLEHGGLAPACFGMGTTQCEEDRATKRCRR